MLLTQYDEQAHIEYEKEISYEEGKAEGREEGREEGRTEGLVIGTIRTYQKLNLKRDDIILALVEDFNISEEDATSYLKQYGV